MWRNFGAFAFVILAIFGMSTKVQSATCTYQLLGSFYYCNLVDQNIQSEDDMREVFGEHLNGFGDVNVTSLVALQRSTIAVFPSLIINRFVNLRRVLLERTNMTTFVSPITNCAELERVQLDVNRISSLPRGIFRNCAQLRGLQLTDNEMNNIHIDAFEGLLSLREFMVGNHLEAIPFFEHLPELRLMSLGDNRLKTVSGQSFRFLVNLELLFIDNNRLETVDFSLRTLALPRLRRLSLRNNQITHLPDNAFSMMTNLVELELTGNKLQRLGEHSIRPTITRLISLDIMNNQVEHIDRALFNGVTALRVLATGNVCINEHFVINNDFETQAAAGLLRECFGAGGINRISFVALLIAVFVPVIVGI